MQGNDGSYEPGFHYTIDSDNQLPVLNKLQHQKEEKKVQRKQSEDNSLQNQQNSQDTSYVIKQQKEQQEKDKDNQSKEFLQVMEDRIEINDLSDSDGENKAKEQLLDQNQGKTDAQLQEEKSAEEQKQQIVEEEKKNDNDQPVQVYYLLNLNLYQPLQQQQQPTIGGKKLPYAKPLTNITFSDKKQFLTSPAPKGGMIQCTIKRDKTGMGRLYPKYHMHLSQGYLYLMSSKKQALNNTSNYFISMTRNDVDKKNENFLGKVRSNFMGTEFIFYDNGENPSKTKQMERKRCELGAAFYESNLLASKGPRKMRVLLPEVSEEGQIKQFRPNSDKEGIILDYKNGKKNGVKEYVNRQPKWNEVVQAFVLNFYGRVDKPSVKNFQLIDSREKEEIIYLQFGRVGDDIFNLDFMYPLTPLQAFQISLSSFDYKFACE